MLTNEEAQWLEKCSPIWLGKPVQLGGSARLGDSTRLGNVIELDALLDIMGRKFAQVDSSKFSEITKALVERLQDADDKAAVTEAINYHFTGV